MRIYHGYRIYFGVSPVQIMDSIKGTHLSSMSDAGGDYWKSAFSLGSPIESIKDDLSTISNVVDMYKEAVLDAKAQGESFSAMSLGSPTWKFDLSIGMYFDFVAANVTQDGYTERDMIFSGMGGYVSVSLGFRMAWYVILPVVFVPGYLGIEINGTIMGFLGANFNKDVQITYDVYAAIVELDGKAIKTKTVNGVTVADTEVTRISNDRIGDYYDADPTVVCDMEKPYRITEDDYHNDELTAAMSGENLVVVHNRYRQELNIPNADTSTQGDKSTYSGETDDSPLIISDMTLVADTLEPCGSVETESIRLYSTDGTAVTLPRSGDVLNIDVEVSIAILRISRTMPNN